MGNNVVAHPSSSPPVSPAGSYYQSTLHPPHKPCMARFLRSSNVPESSLPPSVGPLSPSYAGDPQAPHPTSSSSSGYPPRDRMGAPAFHHHHPGQPQYGPLTSAHGVYAPLYDSRRVWRPQVSRRPTVKLLFICYSWLKLMISVTNSCTTERMPGVTHCLRRCCIPPSTSLHSGRDSTL